jgi:hypothetical protein
MNGAESLVRTLVKGGVEVCFANPGTSEMHFVGALDRGRRHALRARPVRGRVLGRSRRLLPHEGQAGLDPLHLGPGLANAAANLHNAKKAGSGIVNIVGEHALYHIKYDTPLTADIEGIAKPFSHWVKTSPTAKTVATDGAAAIQAARVAPGQIATLILPADTAVDRGRRRGRHARDAAAAEARQRGGGRGGQGAEGRRRLGDAVHRRPRAARARAGARRQDRRQDRLQGAGGRAARRASSAAPAGCRCCACTSWSRPRSRC